MKVKRRSVPSHVFLSISFNFVTSLVAAQVAVMIYIVSLATTPLSAKTDDKIESDADGLVADLSVTQDESRNSML